MPTIKNIPAISVGKIGWPWTGESSFLADSMPDGSPWPTISVVTPSYNQGQFIEETIRSVLLQGYPNLEYIIMDGDSTDNTLEIIKKYEPWLAYWISEPDRGQSHAINKGIQKATGDILLWINSDDICLPDAFAKVALAFCSNPSVGLITGQAQIINHLGQDVGELRSNFTSWEELATNPRNSIRQISTFFARKVFDELGFVDENLHIAMDTELLVRITKLYPPLILEDYLTAYRVHSETKTFYQIIRGYQESDWTRPKYLAGANLVSEYRKRSSLNWLSLSESQIYPIRERALCLYYALKNRLSVIYLRNFWSSLKKLVKDFLHKTRR